MPSVPPPPPSTSKVATRAGDHLRHRVESLGSSIADRLSALVAAVPGRPSGPQALGRALGMTTVTASRLLKAIGQTDPVAVLQLLPGPNPMSKMVAAARRAGTDAETCDTAQRDIDAFDELIRIEAGDRGSLKAMLSAWLPEDRREFEAQRRQTIFKALTELDGVSCEFELSTTIVAPAADVPNRGDGDLDIVSVKCLQGIDRIRPDAIVKLGTRRVTSPMAEGATEDRPRVPLNLEGEPALDGLHTVRLDEFCNARPAPFDVREFGGHVQYSLGPTGFGRGSKVDLVIAEVNRGELFEREPNEERPPYFFSTPEMATRKAVFDLLVHEDVYRGATPEIINYDTSAMGPAAAHDPARELDRRYFPEPLGSLGPGIRRARLLEFPRYASLLEHVAQKLDYDLDRFRLYRAALTYPLVGNQITLAFTGKPPTP